jgi:copper(I)-binding protein
MSIKALVLLAVGLVGIGSLSSLAMEGKIDHSVLHAAHGWVAETIPGTKNGAIYLTIHNPGTEADRLIGVDSTVAEKTEIHESKRVNHVASMARLEFVDVPAGEHVEFKPGGGPHVMLIGITTPLKVGDMVELNLTFETAGVFKLMVPVVTMEEGMGGKGHDPSHHHQH